MNSCVSHCGLLSSVPQESHPFSTKSRIGFDDAVLLLTVVSGATLVAKDTLILHPDDPRGDYITPDRPGTRTNTRYKFRRSRSRTVQLAQIISFA